MRPVPPDPDAMKKALRCLPTGVTVVTYHDDRGSPCGMTANAVCSVSLAPPLLLACLNRSSRTCAAIEQRRRFGVNVLSVRQRDIAEYCATPGQRKELKPAWVEPPPDTRAAPVIAGALSYLGCTVASTLDAGTHAIVVGAVERIVLGDPDEPLAYFAGAYCRLDRSPEARVDAMWDLLVRAGY